MTDSRERVRAALVSLIERKDGSVFQTRARFEHSLAEASGVQGAEIAAISAGLDERLPWDFRKNPGVPITRAAVNGFVENLSRKHHLSADQAQWVVATWAGALGISIEPPPQEPSIPPFQQVPSAPAPASTPSTGPSPSPLPEPPGPVPAEFVPPSTALGIEFCMDDRGLLRVSQAWSQPSYGPADPPQALASWVRPGTTGSSDQAGGPETRSPAPPLPPTIPPAAPKPPQAASRPPASSPGKAGSGARGNSGPVLSRDLGPKAGGTVPSPVPLQPKRMTAGGMLPPGTPSPAAPAPAPASKGPPLARYSGPGQDLHDRALEILKSGRGKTALPDALELLEKASRMGNLASLYKIGEIHLKGLTGKENLPEAVACFRKAAEKGYVEAQVQIGSMYQVGHGVPLDLVEAQRWLQMAAKQGNQEARELLNQILQA